MASRSEENLNCPVCHCIFKEPVFLSCSHSFCKACIQTWWAQKTTRECPLCKRRSSQSDPPLNLALKNLCEDFSQERSERLSTKSEDLCTLHSEKLKLFCLDHQQPVCVICLHSETHSTHNSRPIDEAARDYKEILRELLKPIKEKLELFNDIKENFDQTDKNIEVQAQDTERQIRQEFSMLQRFLQKEEQERISALREEKLQKSWMIKRKIEDVNRETAALSDTVRATEEVLKAKDLSFLQSYKTAAERVQHPLPDVPEPAPGALIDTTKHLNSLSFALLENIKKMMSIRNPQPVHPEPPGFPPWNRLFRLRVGEGRSYSDHQDSGFCSDVTQSRSPEPQISNISRCRSTLSLALNHEPNDPSLSTGRPQYRSNWNLDYTSGS